MPASPIVSHQNPLFHEKLALKASFFLLFGITIAMAQETTLRSPDFRKNHYTGFWIQPHEQRWRSKLR